MQPRALTVAGLGARRLPMVVWPQEVPSQLCPLRASPHGGKVSPHGHLGSLALILVAVVLCKQPSGTGRCV